MRMSLLLSRCALVRLPELFRYLQSIDLVITPPGHASPHIRPSRPSSSTTPREQPSPAQRQRTRFTRQEDMNDRTPPPRGPQAARPLRAPEGTPPPRQRADRDGAPPAPIWFVEDVSAKLPDVARRRRSSFLFAPHITPPALPWDVSRLADGWLAHCPPRA